MHAIDILHAGMQRSLTRTDDKRRSSISTAHFALFCFCVKVAACMKYSAHGKRVAVATMLRRSHLRDVSPLNLCAKVQTHSCRNYPKKKAHRFDALSSTFYFLILISPFS
jgi:hypothetical protein